jgi:hypothetical protein
MIRRKYNSGIYSIEFDGYEKVYIGSTINFSRRKSEHLYLLKKNKHRNRHLQNIYNKHKDKIQIKLFIYTDHNKEYVRILEQKIINCYNFEDLINICDIVNKPTQIQSRKFKKEDIIEIFNLAFNLISVKDISSIFSCSKYTIYNIISRKTYFDIYIDENIIISAQKNVLNKKNKKFSEFEINYIKENSQCSNLKEQLGQGYINEMQNYVALNGATIESFDFYHDYTNGGMKTHFIVDLEKGDVDNASQIRYE